MKISAIICSFGYLLAMIAGRNLVVCQETATTTTQSDAVVEEESVDLDAEEEQQQPVQEEEPVQSGPLIDLLGPKLESLKIVDEQSAQVMEHYTNEALAGKTVIGLYFSADWCGPCRQFTPELVSFYERMNQRRGHKDKFEIVMISRCRDINSHYQYFSKMPWLALPFELAAGQLGQVLGDKYGVKGIPSLVLIDDLGQTITTDARNKIPADKAGIGFPWRNPISQLYSVLVPRSLRMMVKLQIDAIKTKVVGKVAKLIGRK
mmetsp:Transcript_12155/g.28843  ORF Transcript_12155/g.28843 Transcript_12155/m.28843 type:complete len:262 (-) Transcript_12155:48-833(-)